LQMIFGLTCAVLVAILVCSVQVQGETKVETTDWNGYKTYNFQVDGRQCLLVAPKTPLRGNPWIWRTEFFGAFPEADIALLHEGVYVAYMEIFNMFGAPSALGHMDKFYDHLIKNYKLNRKTVLEGFSRGGLFAFNWAVQNPKKVAAIYVDAPVCDFKSWPGGKGKGPGSPGDWEACKKVYGFTEEQAMAYKGNPVDNLKPLADAKIPILSVCGEADTVVPIEENTRVVEKRYKELGGGITVIAKPNCDHHPHSLSDPISIVNFVLENTRHKNKISRQPKVPYGYDYFKLRSSMDNSRIKFEREGVGRVATLGGSITQMSGWRELLFADIQNRFPKTKFDFISAGIGSLGSTPHSFRLEQDVLSRGPVDLLFVEAAVNDECNGQTDIEQIRGMEGIIRHALLSNPNMDIVVMHFVDPSKMDVYKQGKIPAVIINHEKVAEYYSVESIDLAKEVTERIHAGEFTWENDFKDLHPAPFGHKIYAASISRMLDAAWKEPLSAEAKPVSHPINDQPLDAKSYYRGRYVSVKDAVLGDGWKYVDSWNPRDGKETRAGFVDVPAVTSNIPGSSLKLDFEGIGVGVFVASGPDTGIVEYSIDGGPFASCNLFSTWSPSLHLPWAKILTPDLPMGKHTMTLRVSADKDANSTGHAVNIIHFLVN